MADVTIENDLEATSEGGIVGRNIVCATSSNIYAFYLEDTTGNLEYRKSTNGGSSFAAPVTVRNETADILWCAIWFDKWTPGDSGTLIHIWTFGITDDDVVYYNLDTSSDSLSSPVVVFAGASSGTAGLSTWGLSGCKAKGGNLFIYFDIDGGTETGFYRSTDGGVNWTSRASPFEITSDYLYLFPANLADTQDIWALYHDSSADAVTLKTHDDSANSWAESSTITTATETSQANQRVLFNGSVRHSDGHLIAVVANAYNVAGNDIECWNITNGSTFAALTNVVSNQIDCRICAVFIDQNTDDLYVAYVGDEGGAETWATDTKVYYKKSTDDGSTWGSQTAYGETGANINAIVVDLGGTATRFLPAWADKVANDLFCNFGNSVAITPPAAPAFQHYGRPHGELGQRQMTQLLAT